jgi:uncharacterized protein (TIGR03083 family)
MDDAAAYGAARTRLLDLAATLSDEDATRPVPACPGWVVKDVYAHLAGVVADVIEGRLEGVATDPWTARQVALRADLSLAEVTRQWAEQSPAFDAGLASLRDAIDPRLVIDVWTHEQDIRGALGRVGARTGEPVESIVDRMLRTVSGWWDDGSLPPLRVVTASTDVVLGAGEPVVLRASDFEIARALLGRRTPEQVAALDWEGDPGPLPARLHVFGPAAQAVVE